MISINLELHKNIFVVAANEHEAKQKSVQQISEWESPHRDYLHQVDTVFDLSTLFTNQHNYLHLIETKVESPFEFICLYTPIGKLL